MLFSVFKWLSEALGGLIDFILKIFMNCLDLSKNGILSTFPVFMESYRIFQFIGVGLAVLIAIIGLYQFFFVKFDAKYTEHPTQILFRTGAAVFFIYYGGYILDYIIEMAATSFRLFQNLSATEWSITESFSEHTLMQNAGTVIVEGVLDSVLLLAALFFFIVIGVNLFKLMVEIAERYLMVAILAFTAPLVFSTIASSKTQQIIRKWISMFAGSCVIMSLSAFSLKAIVNGIANLAGSYGLDYFPRILLILAMCKIAQRIDSYMQQLGIGVATTGGNLLDVVAGAATALLSHSRHGNSKSTVLGANGQQNKRTGIGAISGAIFGLRDGRDVLKDGGSVKAAGAAAKQQFVNSMKNTAFRPAFDEELKQTKAQNKANGKGSIGATISSSAKGVASGVGEMVAPGRTEAMRKNQEAAQATAKKNAAEMAERSQTAAVSDMQRRNAGGKQPMPAAEKLRAQDPATRYSRTEADANFREYGTHASGQSCFGSNTDIKDLAPAARAAGLSIETAADNSQYIAGQDAQIADCLSNEFGQTPSQNDKEKYVNGAAQSLAQSENKEALYERAKEAGMQYENADEAFSAYTEAYKGRNTDPDKFNNTWGKAVNAQAAINHANDLSEPLNKEYQDILVNTAQNASGSVCLSALYDTDRTIETSGDATLALGNALAENAFPTIASDRASGTQFTSVKAYDLEAQTDSFTGAKYASGGRVTELQYKDAGNVKRTVKVYNEAAYTGGLTVKERENLRPYECGDRILWTDAEINKSMVAMGAGEETRTGYIDYPAATPQKSSSRRQIPGKKKKS